jgi:hypothetical protein
VQEPCSADSGSYCKARRRLPLGVIIELVRRTAWAIDQCVPEGWFWKRNEILLVDGSTFSMPDTPANQRAFPQAPGLAFPIDRVVAIISLATGLCATWRSIRIRERRPARQPCYVNSWIASERVSFCWGSAILPRISAPHP